MSKIQNTVETEGKAKEILTSKGAVSFKNTSSRCECGETQSINGYDADYNFIGNVAICDMCGSDDACISEVFYA